MYLFGGGTLVTEWEQHNQQKTTTFAIGNRPSSLYRTPLQNTYSVQMSEILIRRKSGEQIRGSTDRQKTAGMAPSTP